MAALCLTALIPFLISSTVSAQISLKAAAIVAGVLPEASLSHVSVVTNCSTFQEELDIYTPLYGVSPGDHPVGGASKFTSRKSLATAGTPNGTYVKRIMRPLKFFTSPCLLLHTRLQMAPDDSGRRHATLLQAGGKIAFLDLNEKTYLEFLCADDNPSYWYDPYFTFVRGF